MTELSAASVLVIEDDPGLNLMLQHRLARSGYRILSATSGQAGIAQVLTGEPTLMLLDYALPDMLCIDLVHHLKERGCCPPFIIVTGQGDEKVAVKMMKLGARDYIVKDESLLDMLPHVVDRAFEDLAREQRLAEARREIERLNAELEERVRTRTAELRAAHERARVMMQVAEGANNASGPDSAVQIAMAAACQHIGWSVGHAFWVNADYSGLIPSGNWFFDTPGDFSASRARPPHGAGHWLTALLAKRCAAESPCG